MLSYQNEKGNELPPQFFLVDRRRAIVGQTFRHSVGVEGGLLGDGR